MNGTQERPISASPPATRIADGVICFGGEDWWYHNRGHFDMQLMRELSHRAPVLYVNSIGMRVPRPTEGAMFFTRVRRKLKSLRRGLVHVRENFSVLSPIAAPGSIGRAITRRVMPAQILRAARSIGIERPLLWVACPPGAQAIDAIKPVGLVYQRTDRFEDFPHVDRAAITAFDRRLKDASDTTLFCSRLLYEAERDDCRNALFVDHGVDYDRFAAAGQDPASHPAEVRDLPRPRVGFVGGIDAHTFDPPLFEALVDLLPDLHFVMVGACSLPEDWLADKKNLTFLGQKQYDDVPGYMAACDVLIMPWNRSDWIKACNPIKLKEYLAVGRPVVSTSYDELLRTWSRFVAIADGAPQFAAAIRQAVLDAGDGAARRARVEQETWGAKAQEVLLRLRESGLELRPQRR
ncbi:MAG: glycosyltransferase [Phycisphaerae bacterium]|nr:glycosyltransferase [Phycisphaerae bacterium]